MDTLRWLRVIGDTLFALGAVLLVAFVAGLASGHSYRPGTTSGAQVPEPLGRTPARA